MISAMSAWFVALFGLLILISCAAASVRPRWLFDLSQRVMDQGWLMGLAVGIRIALGIALLIVAGASALPQLFQIIGWFAIVAAITLPFIGMTRIRRLIDWIASLPTIALRAWLVVGIAFGGLLLYGVYPLFFQAAA